MMTNGKMIAIIKAYDERKTIEYKPIEHIDGCYDEWIEMIHPDFDFNRYNYRIKPEEDEMNDVVKEIRKFCMVCVGGVAEGVFATYDLALEEAKRLAAREGLPAYVMVADTCVEAKTKFKTTEL